MMRINLHPPDDLIPGVVVHPDGRSTITGWAVDCHHPTSHPPLAICPTAGIARAVASYWIEHHGARVRVLPCEVNAPAEYGDEWAEAWGLG